MSTQCPKCGEGGKPTYKGRRICKDCYRKQRKANRKRSQKFVHSFKVANPHCLDCKNPYLPCILEFDHRPGVVKTGAVSDLAAAGCSIETIQKEIKKCDLVCANCHRIRTYILRKPHPG